MNKNTFDVNTVNENQLPTVISSQFKELTELENNVVKAMDMATQAKRKANDAQVSAGLFKKKKAIEALQEAVKGQANALIPIVDAQKLLLKYQAGLTKITIFLANLGAQNLAMNRAVVRELELRLKGASDEEFSDLAKQELIKVIADLKNREDMMNKQSKIAENVGKQHEDIKKLNKQIDDMKLHMPEVHSVCKECGKLLTSKQIVCSYCGRMVDKLPYDLKSFDINYKETEELKELARVIKSSKKNPTWIYPEMEDKFLKMQKIQDIAEEGLKQKEIEAGSVYRSVLRQTKEFFEQYNGKKIEIALVGTVKAGKSSLINALIGTKVASVDATPETSILTKYRTTKNGNYLKIKYYTENEWKKILDSAKKDSKIFFKDYKKTRAEDVKYEYLGRKPQTITCSREELSDTIMEWTNSESPKHFFVKEIEVGYESDNDNFPNDVYLVDTPGLEDHVEYRSKIARDYIKKSDWVIACFKLDNASEINVLKTLTSIRSNKNNDVDKIFIVATKRDQLSESEANKKIKESLNILSADYEKCGIDTSLAVSRFSSISANCHIYCKSFMENKPLDNEQKRDFRGILCKLDMDMNDLYEADKVRKVLDYAGVDNLFEKMDKCVIRRKRDDILKEIEKNYYKTMEEINKIASENIVKTEEQLKSYISDNETSEDDLKTLKEARINLKKRMRHIEEFKENLEVEIETDSIKMEV